MRIFVSVCVVFLLIACAKAKKASSLSAPLCDYGAFATVDDFRYSNTALSINYATGAHANTNAVYVVGYGAVTSSPLHWLVRKSTDGTTWSTVDDFAYVTNHSSAASAIAQDSQGNLFVAGSGRDASDFSMVIVRRSVDQGVSWNTVDTFIYNPGHNSGSLAIGIDASDHIYVAGGGSDATHQYWITRKSSDHGMSWSSVDSFNYPGASTSAASAVAFDASGGIYVTGSSSNTGSTSSRWLTRKSADGGASWTTVDDYVKPGSTYSISRGLAIDPLGNIFAAGDEDGTQVSLGTVRRSSDQGATWQAVDEFTLASDSTGNAYQQLATDNTGHVIGVGLSFEPSGYMRWFTRISGDAGAMWTSTDSFRYFASGHNAALGLAISPNRQLYVVGHGEDTNSSHWLTRVSRCE